MTQSWPAYITQNCFYKPPMSKFSDDVSRILNRPVNKIKGQVLHYMETENYKTYSQLIFPVDRASYIYEFNYKSLTDLFQKSKENSHLDDRAVDKRNEVLKDGMVHIHNYLSSQFSLLDILKLHAEPLPLKNQLLGERKKLMNEKITKFFSDLRNNILHKTNFGPSLRFDSKWGRIKIVYPAAELLKSNEWKNSIKYIQSLGDYVMIEDLIHEYHTLMNDFLNQYEAILFAGNSVAFQEVITTLLGFAKQYGVINEKGFLPVSEEYLTSKSKFTPPD